MFGMTTVGRICVSTSRITFTGFLNLVAGFGHRPSGDFISLIAPLIMGWFVGPKGFRNLRFTRVQQTYRRVPGGRNGQSKNELYDG